MDGLLWAFCVHVGGGGVGLWEESKSPKLSECSRMVRSLKPATQVGNGFQDCKLEISNPFNPFPASCCLNVFFLMKRNLQFFLYYHPDSFSFFLLYHLHEIERVLKVNSFPFQLAWTIVWIGFSPRREIVILYLAKVPAAHPASRLSCACVHLDVSYPSKCLLRASHSKMPEERPESMKFSSWEMELTKHKYVWTEHYQGQI